MIDPGRWGVETGYHDAQGRWTDVPGASVEAVLASMGADDDRNPSFELPVLTARRDRSRPQIGHGVVHLEDGGEVQVHGTLPDEVPSGYHRFAADDAPEVTLVVSPGRCPAPPTGRQWGWAAQLYATRSAESWGIGDLADLRRLCAWSASLGAGMILLNPLHAAPPGAHQEPSPYFASSRCFPSPLYLRIEEIPGAGRLDGLEALSRAGRALDTERIIDRDRVWALKSSALETLYETFDGNPDFDRFCADRLGALTGFATWSALADTHGAVWREWPEHLRRPDGAGVTAFSSSPAGARRIRYHQWLQWHLDVQLAAASHSVGLMQDLAIGVNAGGADSWLWQDTFAPGMRVGAPADEFNTLGQDWGLPPWDPWRLRAAAYAPLVETVRGGLRHAGGLRFDHVMGLFRLYWIPEGASATEGVYVRYPDAEMLDVLALEAERAQAYVVGEDLGTVEDRVRHELADRGVLSYRLFWFEPGRPDSWPEQALGAVTTHDLPTVAGVWSGSDIATQRRLDLSPNEDGARQLADRLTDWTGAEADDPVDTVVERAYGMLAQAPCAVLTASLDDIALVEERPNIPGTTDEWPNWSIALPVDLDALERSPVAARVAAELNRSSPGSG